MARRRRSWRFSDLDVFFASAIGVVVVIVLVYVFILPLVGLVPESGVTPARE